MTPELKTACEVVFQEHKISTQPIKWGRDSFRGRISIGLSELAKETLVKKNIIVLPDKSKKVFTQLNPDVASAISFEEAEKIIGDKIHDRVVLPAHKTDSPIAHHAVDLVPDPAPTPFHSLLPAITASETIVAERWWLKPIYLYLVWPVCGAAAGVLISLLLNFVYSELFK